MNPAFDQPFLPNPLAAEDPAPAPKTPDYDSLLMELDAFERAVAHRDTEIARLRAEVAAKDNEITRLREQYARRYVAYPEFDPGAARGDSIDRPRGISNLLDLRSAYPRIKEAYFEHRDHNNSMHLCVTTDDGERHASSLMLTKFRHGQRDAERELCQQMSDYLFWKGYRKPDHRPLLKFLNDEAQITGNPISPGRPPNSNTVMKGRQVGQSALGKRIESLLGPIPYNDEIQPCQAKAQSKLD